jgi:hypothetical protein
MRLSLVLRSSGISRIIEVIFFAFICRIPINLFYINKKIPVHEFEVGFFILENIKKRDIIDSTRAESPLKQADDAVVIDTTYMTLDEQVDQVILLADMVVLKKW